VRQNLAVKFSLMEMKKGKLINYGIHITNAYNRKVNSCSAWVKTI
jgi:hypothetical protein